MIRLRPSDENTFGGKWSIKKLECVEAYLDSYLSVMQNQDWAKLWYVDAFSGDGYQSFKSTEDGVETLSLFEDEQPYIVAFTAGSAMRAIGLSSKREADKKRTFDRFVFLEYSSSKLRVLRERIAEQFPDQIEKCIFIPGDVNESLPDFLYGRDWRYDRAVTFIDPYATQLEWGAIESFKGTCSDVWLLFPLSSVLRMLPRSGLPSGGNSKRLTKLFGDASWSDLYRNIGSEQLALFEDEEDKLGRERGYEELLEYVTKRYESVFPEVCGHAVLRTEKNIPLFALYSMVANDSARARETSRRISRHLIRQLEG